MIVAQWLRRSQQELSKARLWSQEMPEEEVLHRARFEAETLLLWVLRWDKTTMLTSLSDELSLPACEKLSALLAERMKGTPLQYITEAAPFYGRLFSVRPGCLIPRPETEVLVERAVDWIQVNRSAARVVDLGTGSGIIATTVKLECPDVEIEALDVSPEALDIARDNARQHGAQVEFRQVDGLFNLGMRAEGQGAVRIHVLLSNPPYIPTEDIHALEREVRDFEPKLALDGGEDGLDYYRRIADIGDAFFESGPAAIFFEVGASQAEAVVQLYQNWSGWTFRPICDLRGIERVVFGERKL